ncbi:MAG: PEP-CTERM sorting domain-containing protein [Burkholderiales bacterium]|nr:MAG: PEP-CTERM sorting domain-containing protein [Burkholderiales bacterium]
MDDKPASGGSRLISARGRKAWWLAGLVSTAALPALAGPVVFSTGGVDGRMAAASRPATPGRFEIETADDFTVSSRTRYTHATVTGLLTGGAGLADIQSVATEVYRVFPNDANTGRTPNVPTRTNSPSDLALTSRDSGSGSLSFTLTVLSNNFVASNSVAPGGIHASPNQTTGGNGAVGGIEVLIDIAFSTALELDADHYFFAPQLALAHGDFYWLSTARPIAAQGTPFSPDLQGWTRDAALGPDWLRVGTDIVGGAGAPTYNFAFSLDGQTVAATVPEPSAPALVLLATAAAWAGITKRRR